MGSTRIQQVGAAVFDTALRALAALLLASMLAAALHDVSRAWDVWYYHLPFAARLGGVVAPDAFIFHPANQTRFDGYPRLGELLQGLAWRVTGRAESANLVSFVGVPLFAWFLRRRFHVPFSISVLALLAIPLVHLHATSCYVDLPANLAAGALVLLAIEAHASPAKVSAGTLGLAGFTAAVAINMRFQLHPVVLLALIAIGWRALPPLFRGLRREAQAGPALAALPPNPRRTLAAIVLSLPIVFATPLANLAVHHNPYYPERLSLLGYELPGPEATYSASPPWLAEAPRPVRFACSLLEIGIRPFTSQRRWTVDQWMPDDSTGSRLGGFFNVYVVAHLALFGVRLYRDRSRAARAAGAGFAAITTLTAVMPQSHELRYYLFWMIVLVSLNLALACKREIGAEESAPPWLRALGALSAGALLVVLAVTRGGYAYPSGSSFAELVREEVDERAIERIGEGERVCVQRAPWNLLWVAAFHPPRRYSVKEAERSEECEGARPLE